MSSGSGSLAIRYALTMIVLAMVSAGTVSIFAFTRPYAESIQVSSSEHSGSSQLTSSISTPSLSTSTITSGSVGGTSYVVIKTEALQGPAIFGFYVQVFEAGKEVATGFTPVTLPLDTGVRYIVYVDPYQNCAFNSWLGTGNSTNGRVVVPSGNGTLTAVMNCSQFFSSTTTSTSTSTSTSKP